MSGIGRRNKNNNIRAFFTESHSAKLFPVICIDEL